MRGAKELVAAAGTSPRRLRCGEMSEPPRVDPEDQSPQERGMRRRSGETGLAPLTAVVLILMLAAVGYVVWSVVG